MKHSTVASRSGRALLFMLFAAVISTASLRADSIRRVPIFRTGILSDAVGPANLVLSNVYGTTAPEIVTCSVGRAFALTRSGGEYVPVWETGAIDCNALAVGDLDRDGAAEVVVGTKPASGAGSILVYTPHLFGHARPSVQIPGTLPIEDIAIGNVDNDAAPEIVVSTTSDTYVFDAATLTVDWTVTGKGGKFVGIGDLEGDGVAEIVVSGSEGHVLNGVSRSYKWGYVGGFGTAVAMGDVDADGKVEIVGSGSYSSAVTIVDGDTLTTSSFTLGSYRVVQSIAVGDGNNDGFNEIVIGEDQWGAVRGYRRDGTELWWTNNPEHGVSGVAVGDVDGDGFAESVWGAGWTSSGTDGLFVGSPTTHAVEWSTTDLDGGFRIEAADLDGDGRTELAVTSASTDSGYAGGWLRIMDLRGNVLHSVTFPGGIYRLAIGQLDSDPAREIAVVTSSYYSYSAQIAVIDGATGATEWTSPATNYGSPGFATYGPLIVANLDGDPVDEIIVGTTDNKIQLLNGATPILQGGTPALDGSVYDASLADIDANGALDLVVATQNGYYVFKASDLSERLHTSQAGTRKAAATNGSFAIVFDSYSSTSTLVSFAGDTLLEQWRCTTLPSVTDTQYVTNESGTWLAVADANTLQLYPTGGSACPEKAAAEHALKGANDIGFADVNGDGIQELLTGFNAFAEIDLVTFTSKLRGDADGDGLVTDADMDALAGYFFGTSDGPAAGGDVNGDFALRPDDLIYLINYRRGTGSAPPL